MNSEMEARSYYDNMKEEVLAVQDGISGSFLLPARRRSTSMGKSGARRTSWREGVLKDADEPHLPTFVPGMY